MIKLVYTVRFTTPAFLGNAEQNGQWRTPPFKALLRQWWRVAYAADKDFRVDVAEMRREEALLFGHAWLEGDKDDRGRRIAARKSLIRIRLSSWSVGRLEKEEWPRSDPTIKHPDVTKEKRAMPIGSHLYLGFGPLISKGGTVLKANAAIQAGESATLSIALPSGHSQSDLDRLLSGSSRRLQRALVLIDRYGSAGGRSRNGWGSLSLTPLNAESVLQGVIPARPWREALELDWPHAIGLDDQGPLVWSTEPTGDWKELMRELAVVKVGLRTQFRFTSGNNARYPEQRHWLSYPVTRHSVSSWRQNRLPNSLRFKVRPASDDGSKFVGVIVHVPCAPPAVFEPDQRRLESTWRAVHALLDELTRPAQARRYGSIADEKRRDELRPGLDAVTLTRVPE